MSTRLLRVVTAQRFSPSRARSTRTTTSGARSTSKESLNRYQDLTSQQGRPVSRPSLLCSLRQGPQLVRARAIRLLAGNDTPAYSSVTWGSVLGGQSATSRAGSYGRAWLSQTHVSRDAKNWPGAPRV